MSADRLSTEVRIVIPAYREEAVIGDVVREVRSTWPGVLVVDDGSPDGTGRVAAAAGARVLRHAINRGQGAALQTGITAALLDGARFVVTFDADGQHDPGAIADLLGPLQGGEAEIALGSRFLDAPNEIPRMRRWVLGVAVLFTRITSGIRVTDTHNGLRAFSRRAAEFVSIRLDRMAHASELLDQVRASRLPWVEVPVRVRYTQYSRRKGQSSMAAIRIGADYLLARVLGAKAGPQGIGRKR